MTEEQQGRGAGTATAAQDAVHKAEAELQRLIRYLNDEVVPEVRRHGSTALRAAATQLHALASTLDDRNR